MDSIKNQILELNKQIYKDLVKYRRHIHLNPELSYNEFKTAAFVKSILQKHKIRIDFNFPENTVIAIIDGNSPGDTIGLRADMDALPIMELNESEYRSKNSGVMHACGHDAHTASLLGTAIILNQFKDNIKGRIVLVFQHAEEKNPGGAIELIEKGLLKKYDIKRMIAQHVMPETETGKFLFGSGMLMASTDELYVTFNGKGGHAALPKLRSDTVLALTDFIHGANILQSELESDYPFIIAFGKIIAKGAVNVIPDTAITHGTMRTFDESLRSQIKVDLEKLSNKCARKYKCTAEFKICHGYPSLINDIELTQKAISFANELVGNENMEELQVRMTAEDFSYFSREVPSVYYRFGVLGNGKGQLSLHNPKFDIDEKALEKSSAMMAWLAININS